MTAQTRQAVRWPARAGAGLARSLVLFAACLLYPALWALLAWLVWLVGTSAGEQRRWTAAELALIGGWLCVVASTSPICGLLRLLVRRWTGTALPDGYRPTPPIVRMSTGFWWNGHRYCRNRVQARYSRWVNRRLHDPARWRERWALLLVPFGAGLVAAVPPVALAAGAVALTRPGWRLLGLVPLALGIGTAPYAWRTAVAILVRLLRPSPARRLSPGKRLSARVRELTAQRADATAAQAAEIRRIERDLHDGAQARLAAVGVTLATALKLLDTDPELVRSLLHESIATTSTALRELRELVRGINPPVLTERGLADALRALALDTPLAVTVDVDGDGLEATSVGRLDLPVETALYFGVSELLANVVKHARASRVDLRLRRRHGDVAVEVRDDGQGGARPVDGGGLAGLRRRLGVFDGTLSVDSPPGGPTVVRMEVPWTSS